MRARWLILLLAGCTTANNAAMCVTGDQKSCACLGGTSGIQVCLPYDTCQCPTGDDLSMQNSDLSELPDLSAAPDLIGADLTGADLAGADLAGADLSVGDMAVSDMSMGDMATPDLAVRDLARVDLAG